MAAPLNSIELAGRIDALMQADNYGVADWNLSTSPPVVLTYQFQSAAAPDFNWSEVSGITTFPAAQRALFQAAFAEFSDVANVQFREVSGVADADIGLYRAASLGSPGVAGLGGWTYRGNQWDGAAAFRSDIDLGRQSNFDLILHELGHVLGLKHPGNYDAAGGGSAGPFLPAAEDNDKFTVMSYYTRPGASAPSQHLMLYDIAAVQSFWGANLTTRTGNDSYAAYTDGQICVVWDAGGVDTLRYDGNANATIDLRAGAFSSLGAVDNVAIAYGATIENGSGGGGSDFILGNGVANALTGNAGADTFNGGGGDDYLFGGAGADTAQYAGAASGYATWRLGNTLAVLTHGGEAHDTLTDVETLNFADRAISSASVATFDAASYLASYADLRQVYGSNQAAAFDHYIHFGFAEQRAIFVFDPWEYLASYDDLIAAYGANEQAARLHYQSHGMAEGRSRDAFDGWQYLASYGDLIGTFGLNEAQAAQHFVRFGFAEHRARDDFDAAQYLANYADLRATFGTDESAAARHFIAFGYAEGRSDMII